MLNRSCLSEAHRSPAIKQIKAAYDLGINAFDTADIYSNGLSEVVLGKAIKQHSLPRDEIVIMTKVLGTIARKPEGPPLMLSQEALHKQRYVNQQGLTRKVGPPIYAFPPRVADAER